MTTDGEDKKTIETKTEEPPTNTGTPTPGTEDNKNSTLSPAEQAVVERMSKIFEDKLGETIEKYDKKIDELKKSVDDKDKEIAKLRKVNSEILMSTDLTGNKDKDIDYNEVEFNEVDWAPQVKATLDKIDKKIS
jgi:predicted RNase H-like nuclease (RuvC/YqgF family)